MVFRRGNLVIGDQEGEREGVINVSKGIGWTRLRQGVG